MYFHYSFYWLLQFCDNPMNESSFFLFGSFSKFDEYNEMLIFYEAASVAFHILQKPIY